MSRMVSLMIAAIGCRSVGVIAVVMTRRCMPNDASDWQWAVLRSCPQEPRCMWDIALLVARWCEISEPMSNAPLTITLSSISSFNCNHSHHLLSYPVIGLISLSLSSAHPSNHDYQAKAHRHSCLYRSLPMVSYLPHLLQTLVSSFH